MLAQRDQIDALQGRVFLGLVGDGLRVLVAAAQAGDPVAQTELRNLRNVLREILDSGDDVHTRIAVVRSPN